MRRPRTILALLAAGTAAAGVALVEPRPLGLRLTIDPSTEALLPWGDPATDAYRAAVLDFGDDEIFVIAMETEDIFEHANLAALRRVHDEISRLDGVRGVKSLAKVTTFGYDREAEWIDLRPFVEEIPRDAAELEALRSRALGDPVYRRTLISTDGRTAALNVSFRKISDGEFIDRNLDGRIRSILDAETTDGRRFHVSGRPHIKSVMYHAMVRDLKRLIPIAVGVVTLVLLLVSGTVRGVLLPMATVAAAVIWTFGAIAALERPLTVLTVLLAPTLVAVGSVYGVHVVSRFEEEAAAGGDREAVVLRTLENMIVPVLIAGLTTVVGFAALLLTDVPAVFEIGAFSMLGIASVTLISLTGIPATLTLLPLRRDPADRARSPRLALTQRLGAWLDAGLERLARATRRRTGAGIALWCVATATAVALIPGIVIDTDYLSYFDERAEVRREFEAVNRLLAGVVPLFVVVRGDRDGYLREPDVVRRIEAVQREIEAIPGVSRTISFVDSLRVLNRAVEGDDPEQERVPESRGAVTELLFLMPKGDLSRFATIDHRDANIIVRTGEVGSASMRRLTDRIDAILDAAAFPGESEVQVTGNAALLNRAADGVARAQPLTVGAAALTIFALLAIGMRSISIGLVAMVPNIVPVLIFYGVLGSGAASLSLPTSLIGSIALGIAIDATAHFLVRYRAERRAGCDPEEAALRCGRHVGRPIAIASVMLFLGFLSVTFSQFATIREFGWLCAMTMAVCALTDLILLPAILVRARI